MEYVTPKFSRTQVDRAGRQLLRGDLADHEREVALDVLSNWRSAHAFPLNTIQMDMKTKARRIHSDALAVQRLKRQRSILSKLDRERTMRLTQMQDIGGCRSVFPKREHVDALLTAYANSQAEHEFVGKDDYILSPQHSGYRSVHLTYKYRSKTRTEYNGLLFEIQIRTELQHSWATAVETVGSMLGQSLKASEGEAAWLEFFRHASAAFAQFERSSPVPGISDRAAEVASNLRAYMRSLDVEATLEKYGAALRATESARVRDAGYFLLVLKPEDPALEIFAYRKGQLEQASADYARYEAELPALNTPQLSLFPEFRDYSGAQAVLVGAESFKALRQLYPNYYFDTRKFVKAINSFIEHRGARDGRPRSQNV